MIKTYIADVSVSNTTSELLISKRISIVGVVVALVIASIKLSGGAEFCLQPSYNRSSLEGL